MKILTFACLLLSASQAFAQGHRLDDGTLGTKVVPFDQSGTPASTSQAAIQAAVESLANNASQDATDDSTAKTTGPQIMGLCDDVSTDAVDEGDAGRLRIDCTTHALIVREIHPCTGTIPTTVDISVAADTAVIVSGGGTTKTWICGGSLTAGTAEIVSIWEGTGSACGTNTDAIIGSATEANGISLASNGTLSINTPIGGITAARDICIRLNTTNRVAGWLTYVQQ